MAAGFARQVNLFSNCRVLAGFAVRTIPALRRDMAAGFARPTGAAIR